MITTEESMAVLARMTNFVKAAQSGFCIFAHVDDPREFAANERAADEWIFYVQNRCKPSVAKTWRYLLSSGKGLTVPTRSPDTFDQHYASPAFVPSWRGPRRAADESTEETRKAFVARVRAMHEIRDPHRPKTPPSHLADPQRDQAPVALSDSARRLLGIGAAA